MLGQSASMVLESFTSFIASQKKKSLVSQCVVGFCYCCTNCLESKTSKPVQSPTASMILETLEWLQGQLSREPTSQALVGARQTHWNTLWQSSRHVAIMARIWGFLCTPSSSSPPDLIIKHFPLDQCRWDSIWESCMETMWQLFLIIIGKCGSRIAYLFLNTWENMCLPMRHWILLLLCQPPWF